MARVWTLVETVYNKTKSFVILKVKVELIEEQNKMERERERERAKQSLIEGFSEMIEVERCVLTLMIKKSQ